MSLEVAAWPVLAYVFGFLLVAAALLGKGDLSTALKSGMIVGIVTTIQAMIVWSAGGGYVTATVLGIAGMAFILCGIAGFYKVDTPTVGIILLFTGILLLILGAHVMILAGLVFNPLFVNGLAVLLFGFACFGSASQITDKIGANAGGVIVLLICIINTILAFLKLFNLA